MAQSAVVRDFHSLSYAAHQHRLYQSALLSTAYSHGLAQLELGCGIPLAQLQPLEYRPFQSEEYLKIRHSSQPPQLKPN